MARIGAVAATVFCAVETLLVYLHLEGAFFALFPLLFVCVVISGAYGGAERQRNGHGDDDGQYFALLGVGLLCMCLPVVGLILTIVLNRNGSDKAPAAMWGTILGIALPVLTLLAGFLMSR